MEIQIRTALPADIHSLTELINQLGYRTSREEMTKRFSEIESHNDYKTLVAVADGQVAGMIGMARGLYYEHNGLHIRVLALVTLEAYRKIGIGHKLIMAAEQWAKEIGARAILLTSGNREERKAAYQFYQGIGFEIKSSGFVKQLL